MVDFTYRLIYSNLTSAILQESADNVDPNSTSSKDALLEEACKKYAEATRLSPTLFDVSPSLNA